MAMEHAGIGNVVISVRYQLLQQHLTVRIVEAFYNDRLGIQLPSKLISLLCFVVVLLFTRLAYVQFYIFAAPCDIQMQFCIPTPGQSTL